MQRVRLLPPTSYIQNERKEKQKAKNETNIIFVWLVFEELYEIPWSLRRLKKKKLVLNRKGKTKGDLLSVKNITAV